MLVWQGAGSLLQGGFPAVGLDRAKVPEQAGCLVIAWGPCGESPQPFSVLSVTMIGVSTGLSCPCLVLAHPPGHEWMHLTTRAKSQGPAHGLSPQPCIQYADWRAAYLAWPGGFRTQHTRSHAIQMHGCCPFRNHDVLCIAADTVSYSCVRTLCIVKATLELYHLRWSTRSLAKSLRFKEICRTGGGQPAKGLPGRL